MSVAPQAKFIAELLSAFAEFQFDGDGFRRFEVAAIGGCDALIDGAERILCHQVFSQSDRFPVTGCAARQEPVSRASSISHSRNAPGLISTPIAAEAEVMVLTNSAGQSPEQSGQYLIPDASPSCSVIIHLHQMHEFASRDCEAVREM